MFSKLLDGIRRQWMGALALFLVLTGGVAYGANTIFSTDIVNNEVYSADVRNDTLAGGGLAAPDLRSDSVGTPEILSGGVRSAEVANQSLTGADVKAQSGVDTCTHGAVRFGELCVGVANLHQNWLAASDLCANLELRLPSLGEARSLATNYDLPNVDENEFFWTDDNSASDPLKVWIVTDTDNAGFTFVSEDSLYETVCVTTPTN